MSTGTRKRPPLSPREAWISDGRQVLHFRPTLWDRWSQRLEITSGELLPDQPVPLLHPQPLAQRWRRWELSRKEPLRLWAEKPKQGWHRSPRSGSRDTRFEADPQLQQRSPLGLTRPPGGPTDDHAIAL